MNPARKLLPFIRPYWRGALLSLALLLGLVFLDLAIPRLIQRIVDQGVARGDLGVVLRTSALMLAISLLSMVFAVANNVASIRVGEGVARDLREALFAQIQRFAYSDLDRFSTGKLMVRLTSDTAAVQRWVQVSLRIGTRAPLMMLGSLVLMFATDRELSLSILPLLLVSLVALLFFILRMEPLFRAAQVRLDRLNTVLQENIAGVRLVKAFVRAAFENRRFEDANEDFTARTVTVMRFMAVMSPALTLCVNVGMFLVIWLGGREAIAGRATIGQVMAFTNYLLSTMTPLVMMTMLSNTWANGIASTRRVFEVLDVIPAVIDPPEAHALPRPVRGRVVFEDVSFHYNGDGAVLSGVSLTAEPGETVAILGATGAGKTSLVNLIPRFYDVTAGRVTVDGVDVRRLRRAELLGAVGVVPQETVLFAGTVRDNIRYGCPQADDADVIAAAQAAQAHDFILDLPHGYGTRVEERGVNLSGGQKQRVAIARALLTRPAVLILDDSTSAVDIETETKIQDALAAGHPDQTRFIVAQRISTVLKADRIVVLDGGRVSAQGTHAGLLRTSPVYREIYESQLGNGPADPGGGSDELQSTL